MRADRTPIEEGYAFYDALDELRDAKITPYVTLHHWDFPDWLCDRGGPARTTPPSARSTRKAPPATPSRAPSVARPGRRRRLQTYADQAFARLGPEVHFWATINEPKTVANMGYGAGAHAPGITSATAPLVAGHNMLLVRGGGERVPREVPRRAGGLGDDGGQLRLARTRAGGRSRGRRRGDARHGGGAGMVRGPAVFRRLSRVHARAVRGRASSIHEGAVRVASGFDGLLGLNHYTSLYVSAAELSPANSYLGRAMDWTTSDVNADGVAIGGRRRVTG